MLATVVQVVIVERAAWQRYTLSGLVVCQEPLNLYMLCTFMIDFAKVSELTVAGLALVVLFRCAAPSMSSFKSLGSPSSSCTSTPTSVDVGECWKRTLLPRNSPHVYLRISACDTGAWRKHIRLRCGAWILKKECL